MLVEHHLHLGGNTRQAGDRRATQRHPDSRRGANAIEKCLGPLGHKRLHPVPLDHGPVSSGKHSGYGLERCRIFAQRHSRGQCQRLSRQVVLRGAQSAGHNHQIGPLGGEAECRDVVVHSIADGCMVNGRNPQRASSRLSHWLLVSSACPLTSSLPMEMISALFGMTSTLRVTFCLTPRDRRVLRFALSRPGPFSPS